MVVHSIINGHYRSFTTVLHKLVHYGNANVVSLHEPCSIKKPRVEKVKTGISENKNPGIANYFEIENEIFEKYWKNRKGTGRMYDFNEKKSAFQTLDPFHKSKYEIVLQTNRLHLILNEISERYDCNYIHFIRHPLDCFIAHTAKKHRDNEQMYRQFVNNERPNMIGWSINKIYDLSKKYVDINVKQKDWMSKWLIAWSYVNDIAVKQAKENRRGTIIQIEELFHGFDKVDERVYEHLKLNLSKDFFENTFKPERGFKETFPFVEEHFFNRLDRIKQYFPDLYNEINLNRYVSYIA